MMPSPLSPQAETTSVQQTMQWLETAFARLNRPRLQQLMVAGIEDLLLHRSLPTVAAATPLAQIFTFPGPDLPLPEDLRKYADSFLNNMQPIYPFVSRASVDAMLDRIAESPLLAQDVPPLAFAYLISAFAIIADPALAPHLGIAETYLLYANTLVGQLIATRSFESVQAILLFSIVLRARDQLGWSWDLLNVGVSMAQALQLHQPTGLGSSSCLHDGDSEVQCTWWCLYAFEKILAFDSGRRSRIIDSNLSAIRTWIESPSENNEISTPGSRAPPTYKESLVSLANLLHEFRERSLDSWGQKELASRRLEDAIAKIFQTAGEMETMLQSWQDNVPAEYQCV